MKSIFLFSASFLVTFFIACEQVGNKKASFVTKTDSTQSADKTDTALMARWELRDKQDSIDSIRLDSVMQQALNIAYKNIDKGRFKRQYDLMFSDSTFKVSVEISSDFHFTKNFPHLIIRRISEGQYDSNIAGGGTPSLVLIDLFVKKGSQFKKVLSHEQWLLEYTNDTIQDINGDGFKDFTVNWYGTNGCCPKAFSNVYLSRSDMQSFSESIEFINPTFSPKDKIVRGICYGHYGKTEMYKYRWNGEGVDTVEYVSYEKNGKDKKTGKVIITNKQWASEDSFRIVKRLNTVPFEYKKIQGYDWFVGKPTP